MCPHGDEHIFSQYKKLSKTSTWMLNIIQHWSLLAYQLVDVMIFKFFFFYERLKKQKDL